MLVFARGLAWQWGTIMAPPGSPPAPAVGAPVPPAQRAGLPEAPAPGAAQAPAQAAARAAGAGSKTPLPPTDAPPPRSMVDEHGVSYDAAGVAVMGLDADTGGVYNVPPGRQVRIGGPTGELFDVQPGGRLTRATQVKQWPG
jgi:hypothetical protein